MSSLKNLAKNVFYALPSSYALMFHHIDDGRIVHKSGCVLSYQSFIQILESGVKFISADEFLRARRSNAGCCTITFDDGLLDVYRVAYPELKKRGIPFTIFVVTDLLDTDGYISSQELKHLATDPLVTIGSHGLSHKILKGMKPELQERELIDSKSKLEMLTGSKVRYFAYSHGQYDNYTLKALKRMKCYDFAFGVRGMPTNIITKCWKYHLPRINCENGKMIYRFAEKNGKTQIIRVLNSDDLRSIVC